jgi:dihydropyrimidinase
MDFDLVIRNGTLVTASDTFSADLGVRAGRIAALGQNLRGKEAMDASGLYVLPGAVDPHVHLEMSLVTAAGPTVTSDDWATGTRAAACGGTTTVIDFVEPEPGESLADALAARRAQAEGRAAIDYGLHMTLSRADDATLAEVPALCSAGVTSFKTYTTYSGLKLDERDLWRAYRAVGQAHGLVLTHAENDLLVTAAAQALLEAGRRSPAEFARSRPAAAEAGAIEQALALAAAAQVPLYIVHTSTARGAAALRRAQEQGQAAFGETCAQYVWLTEVEYTRPGAEAARFVCAPPLRTAADREALWQALASGHLQTVGSDHCAFRAAGQKDLAFAAEPRPAPAFNEIPGGLPGIEARLALIYAGVDTGRFSLNRWVEVCCTAPARLFGLYPRKGTLMPGSDADLVLFDPHKQVTVSTDLLHENVDYTPYAGLTVTGWPVATLVHGHVVVREGQWVAEATSGQFLQRTLPQTGLTGLGDGGRSRR